MWLNNLYNLTDLLTDITYLLVFFLGDVDGAKDKEEDGNDELHIQDVTKSLLDRKYMKCIDNKDWATID